MTSQRAELAPRQAARIAGYGYLVIFVLAIFANFFVRERLIEPGDAAATASNILESEALFRLGLVSFLIVFVLDVAIAWALYVFFRPVHRDLSLLTAWFRLVYTVLLGVAVIFLFLALRLLSGAEYLSGFIPKVLGVLLLLAGAGYGIDTVANALLAGYDDYVTLFLLIAAVPSVVGELAFAIWLLLRGGKPQAAPPTALDEHQAPATRAASR
jgi:Domain of unknown function (DUF4386)